MSIAVIEIDEKAPSDSQLSLGRLVEHLTLRWPGTFVLAIGTRAPDVVARAPQVDWVSWPPPDGIWGDGERLGLALASAMIERLEIHTVVGLGAAAACLLRRLHPDHRTSLLLLDECDGNVEPSDRFECLGPASAGQLLGLLDDRLRGCVPVALTVGPASGWSDVRLTLARHAAAERMERIVVRWQGRVDDQLHDLLLRLSAMPGLEGRTIELHLLTSELFDVPRSGMTHRWQDFVFLPAAWVQVASLGRFLVTAPASVTVRLQTVSRKRWIRSCVRLADGACGLVRGALAAVRGRQA